MTRGGKCAGSSLRANNSRAATFGSLGFGSGGSAASIVCLTSGPVDGAVGVEIAGASAALFAGAGPTSSGGVGRLSCAMPGPQLAEASNVTAVRTQRIGSMYAIGQGPRISGQAGIP